MSSTEGTNSAVSSKELDDLVASTDTGGRVPDSRLVMQLMAGLALIWAIWQVWIASPLPYMFNWGVFPSKEARSFHLAFAIVLAFLAYPAMQRSSRTVVPVMDWVLAILGVCCALYLFLFDTALGELVTGSRLSDRPGNPNMLDIVVSCIGILVLLEATRRALGPPLMVVAIVFLFYTFLGP